MKNFINYYYNLSVSNIRKKDDEYIFRINNLEYMFLPCFNSEENISYIYFLIIKNNRYIHEIILNKNNNMISFCDGKPYILIKKNYDNDDLVSIKTIIEYDTLLDVRFSFNWKNLWESKIDYYEYQVKELGYKYLNVKESFYYYVGLSELAISLLNYVNTNEIYPYVQHKRIIYKETYNTFLNPLNIIIDTRMRDIAEYLKINYIHENINIEDVLMLLDNINMNKSESILLLSRLIYPSYYFDIYDEIIKESIDSSKLNYYIEKNVYYETFLKSVYKLIRNRYNIPIVEWLEN